MEFLSTQQVADYLGLQRITIRTWRSNGKGPPFIKVGKFIKYRRADIDQWLEQHTVRPLPRKRKSK